MRAPFRILATLVAAAVVGLLGWTALGDDVPGKRDGDGGRIIEPSRMSGDGEPVSAASAGALAGVGQTPDQGQGERAAVPARTAATPTRLFRGEALLQESGSVPTQVKAGTFTVEIVELGQVSTADVEVIGGTFRVPVPERARVRLKTGEFNGVRVRFPGLGPAFAPVDVDYALVGAPFPLNRLRIVDGPSGADLSGVRVTRAPDMSPVTLRGTAGDELVVVEEAASPIDLPWIESRTPVWLRVRAEGYAPATVRVDPTEARTREVRMWPGADLLVRVTGEGREALKMICLFHEDPDGRTIAGGILERRSEGVRSEGGAWIFDLEGVPALPTRVQAKGVDLKARPVDLAETNVRLGRGEQRTAVLRIDR